MKTIVSTFKQLTLFVGLMIFCFSLTVCGERQVDHNNTPTTPEAAPTTACKQRKSIGGALNEAATLAFDKVLKTYTLTFSPKQDSTLVGIICDTSAYELSKLVGQVKFDGGIRAAGEDAPKSTAAGQGYYSVELKAPPRRQKIEADEKPPPKDTEQTTFTKDATVFLYIDPGFEGSTCWYVVQTDDDEIFVPPGSFFNSDVQKVFKKTENIVRVRITYHITKKRAERCSHKNYGTSFLEYVDPPPNIIEVISIERKRNQNPVITNNATIHYDKSGIDNCVYSVRTDDGRYFTLSELKNEFRENGLKVRISYYLTDQAISCGFGGVWPKIEIISIQRKKLNRKFLNRR